MFPTRNVSNESVHGEIAFGPVTQNAVRSPVTFAQGDPVWETSGLPVSGSRRSVNGGR